MVVKARIVGLRGHLRMILEFGRRSVQHGSMGYYVTTLEACIEQIERMKPEVFERFRKNNN